MTNYVIEIVTLCAIACIVKASLRQSIFLDINDSSFAKGYKLSSNVFYVFEPVGVLQCIRECKLRSKCKIIGWSFQRCHLGENETATIASTDMRDLVSRPTVLSSAIVGNIVGTCDLHTCPSGKKCVQMSNGSPICLTSECPDPPSITSATVTSATRTVNINVSYSCLDGSAGNGNRSTTCKPDGTWTSATLSCPSLTKTTHASSAQGVTETSTVSTFASTSITNGISTSTTLVTTISDSTTQAITTTQSITTTGYEETTPIESDTTAVSDGQQTTTPSKTSIFSDTSSTRVTSADRVSRSTFGASTTKEPGCKDSYTDISSGSVSMCYKVYNDVTDTYDGAKTRCVADGAELMYVRTSDRASVLKTQNGDNQLKNKPYFIDGSDAVVEGVWKHSDGCDVIVALFKKSPTTDNSKNCLAIKNDGQFFDEDCSNSNSFICEILVS